MPFDRRTFLVSSLGVTLARSVLRAGQNGLEAFGVDTLPCVLDARATPAVSPDNSYKAGAPMRPALAADGQKGTPLQVTGIVAGLSCGPIAHAVLELWQPDASGAFDAGGFNLRGRIQTDARGRYSVATIMPGVPPGRAPSIGVHVIVERKAELWTAMFFPGQPANPRDPRFKEELLVKIGGTASHRTGEFDIRIDI